MKILVRQILRSTLLLSMIFTISAPNVAFASSDSSATFTINGNTQYGGETINVGYGTSSVTVVVTPTDPGASSTVSGDSGLSTGSNTVTVVVTAFDGSTTTTYFTINVDSPPLSNDSSATFTIDSVSQSGGATVYVTYGTGSVSVGVSPTEPSATSSVSGHTSLITGWNTVTVVVTAPDGVSTSTTYFTVVVNNPSSDSSATFTINGNAQSNWDTINVAYGTSSVNVVTTRTDSGASSTVNGNSNFSTGSNSINVVVTAADGMSTTTTHFTIYVNYPSNDSSATFTINSTTQVGGDTINVNYGTTSVAVVVTPTDSGASSSISGHNSLYTGSNTVTVVVTAADGMNSTTTYFTVNVSNPSNDSSATFSINSNTQVGGDTIYVGYGTTSVSVTVTPTDSGATPTVNGNSNFYTGSNSINVVVTAADGYGSTTTYFTVVVSDPPSSDSSASFTINSSSQAAGDTIYVSYGTTSVSVVVTPTNGGASSSISGESYLSTGPNTITVIVTAADGVSTTTSYFTVIVNGPPSTDSSATFTINGISQIDGDTTHVVYGTSSVAVVVTPTHSGATPSVSGHTNLSFGSNSITVLVTAEDGWTTTTSYFTVIVDIASSDSSATFTINGVSRVNGDTINLAHTATSVVVAVAPNDAGASASVSGDTGLIAGSNTLNVVVTAADASSTTSSFTLMVSFPPIYTIHFANNGHGLAFSDTSTASILFSALPVQANDGSFFFLGWSTTTHASGILTSTYTPPSDGTTLTAIWRNDTPAVVAGPIDPIQQNLAASYSPVSGSTAGADLITIAGNFPARILSITIDGFALPDSAWDWSPSTITITTPAHRSGVVEIQLWNGQVPLMTILSYTYSEFVALRVSAESKAAAAVEVITPETVTAVASDSPIAVIAEIAEAVFTPIVISFGSGSSTVTSAQAKKLALSPAIIKIVVTGYAQRGNPTSDLKLSQKRANSVAALLSKKYPSLKIMTVAKGGSYTSLCAASRNRCAVVRIGS